jgi:hypothetical protein
MSTYLELFCPHLLKLPSLHLPLDLWARAFTFATGNRIKNSLTMRGGIRPTELLIGKLGEIAAHLWFGVRVPDGLFADHPDPGWDIEVGGFMIDVKGSNAEHQNLIWPASKVREYPDRPFDLLMSVSIYGDHRDVAYIDGVISKAEFRQRKRVVTGDGTRPRLDRGTWYLNKDQLCLIDGSAPQNRIDDLKLKCEAMHD